MKESEIDELRSELQLRKSSPHKNSPNVALDNLKKELQTVVERSKSGQGDVFRVLSLLGLSLWSGQLCQYEECNIG